MSAGLTSASDVTMRQSSSGGGMDMSRSFALCPISHRGPTAGAQWVRGIGFVRCAACNAARKALAVLTPLP